MGQTAHPGRHGARRASRPAALTSAALVAAVALTGCGESVAAAPTTLTGLLPGRDVTVVHSDGRAIAGVEGLRLQNGDVVRTGPGARAVLLTRGRRVYEASQAAVQVLDGARQVLRQGAVVVDAGHGPGLRLAVAALSVDTPDGSAVRAERGVTLRVGSLAGAATVRSDTGRSMPLPALTQVVVGGDALPDAPSPLRLTDDDGEAHAAPALVRDDQALVALAAGVDSSGAATVRTVAAAWSGHLESPPAGVARSEQVLPVVIAAAGQRTDADTRYSRAVDLRARGGSWGVVAHQLHTGSDAVLAALDRLQRWIATGHVGTIAQALTHITGGGGNGSGNGDTGSGGAGGGGGGGGTTPSTRPSPSPTDTSLGGTVTDTIGQVLKLLPTPSPTALVPLPQLLPSLPALPLGGRRVTPTPTPLPH